MRHRIAIILSVLSLPTLSACSPAHAPAPDNKVANATDDELLDTSPDSLTAPDDANSAALTENATAR